MMNRIYYILLSIVIGTMLQQHSANAQPYCDIRTFSIRDGLTANVISGIGQDANGLMWFSTYNGLCCYDGYRFISFRDAENSELLTTNHISAIKPEGKIGVWLITYDRRLYFFDTRTCSYTDISSLVKQKTSKPFLARNIYTLEDNGHTWITGQDMAVCLRICSKDPTLADSIQVITSAEVPLIQKFIKKVRTDDSGHEWIFSDKGITLYGTQLSQEGTFEHIAEVEGRVYLAQPDGVLWSYSKGASHLQRVTLTPAPQQINCLKKGPHGLLLVGTDNGVLAFNPKTGISEPLATATAPVSNINVDHQQRIWVYTANGSIVQIQQDLATHQLHWQARQLSTLHFPIANQLSISTQSLWIEDSRGTVWMAPKGNALCYYDETTQQLCPYALRSQGHGYIIPDIRRSFIDHQHNLWVASAQNLTLVNLKYHDIKFLPLQSGQETRALLSLSDGSVWAGTGDGTIGIYDAKGMLTGYLGHDGRISSSPIRFANKVYALYQDSKGCIWIGTRGDGLFTMENGRLKHYDRHMSEPSSPNSNDIFDFDEDEQGNLWIATYGGGLNLVQRQPDGSLHFTHTGNELKNYPQDSYQQIRRVTHDGKGTVLLSTTDGLVTFSNRFTQPSSIQFYTSQHIQGDTASIRTSDVLQTLVTRQRQIYVTTMGGCIQRLCSDQLLQDNLRFSTPRNQSFGNVLSLTEDQDGNVWDVRETSLNKFTPEKGILEEYGSNELGESIGFTEGKPIIDARSGQMVFPTIGGIVVLHPNELTKSNYQPGIVFTSVQFQSESRPQPLLNKPVLEVPSDKRNLTVFFAALDYHDNDFVRYAYRLEDTDPDWNYVGKEHQAQLSHLTAGKHRLVVRSTNSNGVWSDNETTLSIYVHPTFWETIWAKLLYILLAIIAITVIVQFFLLRRKADMQRELNEMKTRFFTDVSHKLRTPLTLIGGPVSEALKDSTLTPTVRKHLEMVQRNASNMLVLVNKMLNYSLRHGVYITEDETQPSAAEASESQEMQQETPSQPVDDNVPKLLVVEDNDDLRAYLHAILSDQYTVLLAENGKIGLEKATSEQPDFIITDVTMPEMDGLTMVHQIKRKPDICHIPIVVLSAKASLEDRLQGLKEGVDDYITKPFSATYLRQRIENIIAQRRMLQRTWLEQLGNAPQPEGHAAPQREYRLEAAEIVDADQVMMEQLMQFLESRINDQDLRIEEMADAVNLGRTVFYGKVKSIVGMAPVDFLRHIRMQRAEDLISRSQMNVSEVAYAVGFTDPKYFTKCFKKETGMTPSEYREKSKENK